MGAQINAYGTWSDGKILVTNQGTSQVLVYTIKDGTASSTPTVISLKNSDDSDFAGGDGRGSAGIIMNEDGSFWLDGYQKYPTLFNAQGTAQFSLDASLFDNNAYGTAINQINYGNKKYLFATSYLESNKNGGFMMYDITNGFSNIISKNVFYPEEGMGTSGNTQRITNIASTVTEDNTLNVWVCVQGQGIARYTGISKATGLDEISISSSARIVYCDGEVRVVGDEAVEICIYNTLGSLVTSKEAQSVSTALLLPGVYLVKATNATGGVVTGKIAVK